MAKGIRFYEAGGPEVMQWESLGLASRGPVRSASATRRWA
jgi:hypothetical protein